MASPIKYFSVGNGANLDARRPDESENLTLAYQTVGSPTNPAILIQTCFSGKISTTLSFLEGPKAALESSIDWHDGQYEAPAVVGTRAFARVYSTWALSSAWFRQEQWKRLGCATVEDYVTRFWDRGMGALDARDLMCMMQCWRRGDIADHAKGDWTAALASIDAKVLLMPSRTDLYFPPEDSFEEVKHLKNGEARVIESVWGHLAGGEWGPQEDQEFIREEIRKFICAEVQ